MVKKLVKISERQLRKSPWIIEYVCVARGKV